MAVSISRRRFVQAAGLVVATGLTTGAYAWRVEPHWVQLVEQPLAIRNLPERLIGSTLVQLSDLHIGRQVDDGYLRSVFDTVRQLQPELVVVTGDFTSYDEDIVRRAETTLASFPTGSLATLGVLGNHDYGQGMRDYRHADRLAALISASGVQVLRNEQTNIEGLTIVGLDDLWAGKFNPAIPLAGIQKDTPALVLSHNPDTADQPGWGDFSGWILAGHTHGGQCKPPFLSPPILPVKNQRYVSGAYSLAGGRSMYINRGIGHLLRVRFNVRPEITAFRLQRA
ncbi:metallophosphoesterase [Planctomycetaceae bacterium SH139]